MRPVGRITSVTSLAYTPLRPASSARNPGSWESTIAIDPHPSTYS